MIDLQECIDCEQKDHNPRIENNEQNLSTSNQCALCFEPSLQILINNALYHKYLDTQFSYHLQIIDKVMDNQPCKETITYQQMMVEAQQQQFMRRMYNLEQFEYKNKAISEYYKFHQDYPKVYFEGVIRIMQSYYDRKKQCQYKKIKRILRDEQNISITTQKSSSVFSEIQQEEKRSQYSNLLMDLTQNCSALNEQNQSQVWKNMCKKIGQAYQGKMFSPINSTKKTVFDSTQNKVSCIQTKNFVKYLRRQQQKKERQGKYKGFTRSNKQSRYGSIQHQSKQYCSGVANSQKTSKNPSKQLGQKSASRNPFFYEGKFFSNANSKGSIATNKDQRKTKQLSNAPSYQNLDSDSHDENYIKRNKQSYSYAAKTKGLKTYGEQFIENGQLNFKKQKNKLIQKTTQQIYGKSSQQVKVRKRAISYSSLANTNPSFKKNFVTNAQGIKEKGFQVRKRSSSKNYQIFKDKNILLRNGSDQKRKSQMNIAMSRAKSSRNLKTSVSVGKFYPLQDLLIQNKVSNFQNPKKKISIPESMIQKLRGKSLSVPKLKSDKNQGITNLKQKSGTQTLKLSAQQILQKISNINLFLGTNQPKIIPDNNKDSHLAFKNYSTKNMDLDSLLHKKLKVSVQCNTKQTKI